MSAFGKNKKLWLAFLLLGCVAAMAAYVAVKKRASTTPKFYYNNF